VGAVFKHWVLLQLLVPTGMRYLVAIDLTMKSTDKVVGAPFVSPLQAAVLLAMMLLRADKNVRVVTFPAVEENNVVPEGEHVETVPEVMLPIDIDCNISVQANLDKLKEVCLSTSFLAPHDRSLGSSSRFWKRKVLRFSYLRKGTLFLKVVSCNAFRPKPSIL